ncbi:MAG: hypothetical protein RIQ81_43 [Pseudomonadota bacterium]|jgi:pSer/pThr/pTyr-binding forkhead associated (FHA) protein
MARVCPLAERGLGRGAMKAQFGLSHTLCSTQSAAGFNGQPVAGWLVGMNGQHWGEDFRLCVGSLVIGSGYQSNLCVTYPGVSGRHAEIIVDVAGSSIRDLGSRDGTFVNGHQVTTAQILDGDEIAFGPARFIFRTATKFDPGYKPVLRPRPASPVFRNENRKRLCEGWIVGQYGPYAGQDFRLLTGDNFFGAAPGLEVSLVDAKLSPRAGHLAMGNGGCVLVFGSGANPVRRVLQDSDEVQIGSHNFYVKIFHG